jgi:hypothetical protein
MSDDQLPPNRTAPGHPALDPNARAILGRQLRNYYDRMRQTAVTDSLAQLLRQLEMSGPQENEPPGAARSGAASQSGA